MTGRARAFALAATSIGTFIAALQGSVANTALPTIARDFAVSPSDSIWVVNGFQLATTATLLAFASLADARGAHRVYLAGLVLFVIATAGCALAPAFGVLIAMRVLQGLGASAMIVTTQALNRAMFPRAELGRSIAINAVFVATGTAAGPTVGGLILALGSWHEIFWVNVPLGIVSLALGVRYLPRVAASGAQLDAASALLAALGFGGLIYGIDGIARKAAASVTIAIIGAATVAVTLFVRRQTRVAHPLLAVDLFRDRIFSVACIASLCTYTAQGLAYVVLPFFFQSALGRTPLASGMLMSAWPITALVVASRMGALSDRRPAAVLCTLGIVVMGLGIGAFALLPDHPSTLAIVVCAMIGGAGFATFQTPNNRAMIALAPPEKTGRASGIMSMARLSGQTSGAALVAIVFALAGLEPHASSVGRPAIEAALLLACGFISTAAALSAFRMRAPGRAASSAS